MDPLSLRTAISTFLRTQKHCVISTTNADGSPRSALVAFSEHDNLSITIGTFTDMRKYENLQRDPRVSIVVASEKTSLQYEGVARFVEGDEAVACRERHKAKNPSADKYALDPRQRYMIITPTWMRYIDYSVEPRLMEELHI